ncbi:MAG: chemotaxis protein CheW [Gammaproteobacteria bacterium]
MNAARQRDEAQSAERRRELLLFRLGDETYGIDILSVQEIRRYEAVTRLVNTPEHIKGVINLRGTIVTIVDLRIKFNLPDVTYNEFTVVVILNVVKRVIGIVVDAVSDVVSITEDDLKPAPDFGAQIDDDYLAGLATVEDRMIIVLDIESLITTPELGLIDEASAQ